MEMKEQKAKESIHKYFMCNSEKYGCKEKKYCQFCGGNNTAHDCDEDCQADIYNEGFYSGWDEALKNILVDASKELPEYDIDVWVVNEKGYQFFCHRSNNEHVVKDEYDWCNYTGSDIIAWIRPISFDEILNNNKDVLKRLKDK